MSRKHTPKRFNLVKDVRLSWVEEPSVVAQHVAEVDNENQARRAIGRLGYEIPALNAWLVCGSDLEERFRLEPCEP